MLVKGDKIKQVKEIPGFNYVGTEFEVDGFTDMKVQFHGVMGQGVMTLAEFEEYFEKVAAPPPKPHRKWTGWIPAKASKDGLIRGAENTLFGYEYRTNGKKVQLRTYDYTRALPTITVQSSCSPEDTFDLDAGLRLCLARLKLARVLSEM